MEKERSSLKRTILILSGIAIILFLFIFVLYKNNQSSNEQFMFSNLSPGFYRCNVKFVHNGEDVVNQSFNLGYEPEKIDSKKDNKTDLREFWEANLLELSK